jgi:hypothetical protein
MPRIEKRPIGYIIVLMDKTRPKEPQIVATMKHETLRGNYVWKVV